MIATASIDSTIRVWNPLLAPSEGKREAECILKMQDVYRVGAVAWSPDGRQIASISDESTKMWDTESGNLLRSIPYPGGLVSAGTVSRSPDSTRIVSGPYDTADEYTAKVWDVMTGNCLHTLHQGYMVNTAAWSPDSRLILTYDGSTVRSWDPNTGSLIKSAAPDGYTLSWAPDSVRFATGTVIYRVIIWNVANISQIALLDVNRACESYSLAWSPHGTKLAVPSNGHTAKIWDTKTLNCIQTCEGHTDEVVSVAWLPDTSYILTGSRDRTAKVWEVLQ